MARLADLPDRNARPAVDPRSRCACGADIRPRNCAPWPWYPPTCDACSAADLRARYARCTCEREADRRTLAEALAGKPYSETRCPCRTGNACECHAGDQVDAPVAPLPIR
ncbi:hypothetical protein [Actinomadura sp. HBU206391]|uniref:hypothetical protein n=1 Tax=Actinomadura sp. HBU206391 TaxID=2731692 RepID=UPI00164EDD57|nr:hypothetical protein [Actinomadura sp. HBU206391]MBC6463404.1 hypothetical protein [Actinomadura sp. HBU206391]